MSYEQIKCDLDGPLMIVTLNRPDKLNAYTGLMGAEIADAFERADADDAVRAVIVTGAGRAFCAGADVSGGANELRHLRQPRRRRVRQRRSTAAAAALSARSSTAASPPSPPSMARPSASASP